MFAVDQAADRSCQMPDVGRAAALVVDDRHLLLFDAQPQHRPYEVVSRGPEEPRAAHDPGILARRSFPVQLRAPVDGERVGRVRFDVRIVLAAVEDVVRREDHERRTERGGVADTADVHGGGVLRIGLRAVDVRPGGCVQDELETREPGRWQRDVPVGVTEGDHLVAGERLDESVAQLPAGARYEQAAASRGETIGVVVLHRFATLGSAQHTPCSSGSIGSYSSVT